MISELETVLSTAEAIKENGEFDKADYLVEMAKASGLAGGISQEGYLLVLDINASVKESPEPKKMMLKKIFNPLKGGNSTGN